MLFFSLALKISTMIGSNSTFKQSNILLVSNFSFIFNSLASFKKSSENSFLLIRLFSNFAQALFNLLWLLILIIVPEGRLYFFRIQ